MIKINEQFKYQRDHHGWQLIETVETFNRKTKECGTSEKKTFHPKLSQVFIYALERSTGDASIIEAVLFKLQQAQQKILESLKETSHE